MAIIGIKHLLRRRSTESPPHAATPSTDDPKPSPVIQRVEWDVAAHAIYIDGKRLDEPTRMTIIQSDDGRFIAAFCAVSQS